MVNWSPHILENFIGFQNVYLALSLNFMMFAFPSEKSGYEYVIHLVKIMTDLEWLFFF